MLIHRLLFHLSGLRLKHFSNIKTHTIAELESLCDNISSEDASRIEALVDDLMNNEPTPEPHRSMLFHSTQHGCVCNFITAPVYRRKIIHAYQWAIAHHINILLVDYTSPFGLLALETLTKLQNDRNLFRLYAVKGNYLCRRKAIDLLLKQTSNYSF